MLDLVKPIRPGRNLGSARREARFERNFRHGSIDKGWQAKRNRLQPREAEAVSRGQVLSVPNTGTAPADIRDKFQAECPNLSGRECPGFSIFGWAAGTKNNVHFITYWPERNPLFARDVRVQGRDSWRASWKDFISELR
jgi:hypothetical protein